MTFDRARAAASRAGSRGRQAALVVALAIVALTCLPHLRTPQLEPDDFRYLDNLGRLAEGGLLEASIVENRWDSLWWVDTDARVRFFRPTVVASYWLDTRLWGGDYELGLLVTNVLLWSGCVVAAWWLACFWLARPCDGLATTAGDKAGRGNGLPAVVAAAAFAALFCHGEVIWYVAGRTDSLAALGFLVALALHVSGRQAPRRRWLAVPVFALAFLTKEMVVALPALMLLHDLWIERRAATARRLLRAEWPLYSSYALVVAAVYGLKAAALGGEGSALIYPYFVDPLSAAFPGHLLVQLRAYGENLLLARSTPPFLDLERLAAFTSPAGLWVTLAALAGTVFALRRRRLFWFLCALALATWLPVSFVYVSERYLLLPSLALAVAAGLLVDAVSGRRALRAVVIVGLIAWIGHQAWWLRAKNVGLMEAPRGARLIAEGLAPLRQELRGATDLLLVNLPGELFEAQFVESQLRVQLDDARLRVRVLTLMPADETLAAGLRTTIQGDRALVVAGGASPAARAGFPVMRHGRFPFPRVPLAAGRRYGGERIGFEVEVLQGGGSVSRQLRFVFDRPLAEQRILVWDPSPRRELSRVERVRRGRVRLVDTAAGAG